MKYQRFFGRLESHSDLMWQLCTDPFSYRNAVVVYAEKSPEPDAYVVFVVEETTGVVMPVITNKKTLKVKQKRRFFLGMGYSHPEYRSEDISIKEFDSAYSLQTAVLLKDEIPSKIKTNLTITLGKWVSLENSTEVMAEPLFSYPGKEKEGTNNSR